MFGDHVYHFVNSTTYFFIHFQFSGCILNVNHREGSRPLASYLVCMIKYAHVNVNPAPPPGWPNDSDWEKVCCSESPPYHYLSLSKSPPKRSTFVSFVVSEWCWKELLLSESSVCLDMPLSCVGVGRTHFDSCIILIIKYDR